VCFFLGTYNLDIIYFTDVVEPLSEEGGGGGGG